MNKSGFSKKYDISEEELMRTPSGILSAFINETPILTERMEEMEDLKNKDAGCFAIRGQRHYGHFLRQEDVSPTDNHAERMPRYAVLR